MASRKEEKERLRQERLERERQAAQSGDRKRLVGLVAAAVLVLAAVGAIAVTLLAGGDDGGDGKSGGEVYPDGGEVPEIKETDLDAAVKAAGCTFEEAPAEGRDHVDGTVKYSVNPPHSGNHSEVPADDGVTDEAPPTEEWVHSLEHGRLPIQFKPNLAADMRAKLKAFVDADPFHMMLFPNSTDMPFEIAVTAWTKDPEPNGIGHLLGCPKANDKAFDALAAFRTRFRDNDVPLENVP